MVKRIAFTMYPVVDMARARRFYEDDLGLVPTSDFVNGQWVEYESGGCFALTTLAPVKPSADSGGSVAFEVDDVVALTDTLKKKGVTVVQEVSEMPTFLMSIVKDPEGNALMLCQQKTA
jgi:predicted enzyme related to lactoylglutathione lyase